MKGGTKLLLLFILGTVTILVAGIFLVTRPAKVYSQEDLLLENTAVLGTKDSKFTLVEFSDFQCPACKAYKPAVDQIIKEYGDRIVFGYRHFPLPQHAMAENLAIAAEAAGEQGKFWESHAYFFENQSSVTSDSPQKMAVLLGLDVQKFEEDMSSDYLKDRIFKDKRDANQLGVNSTPTFFLNGKKLALRSPQDLILLIQKELEKK
jgi:protein-disulfide isomerase